MVGVLHNMKSTQRLMLFHQMVSSYLSNNLSLISNGGFLARIGTKEMLLKK